MATRFPFSDKVVIVTGSSSGIGEETAVHLSSLGASVVISGRNRDKLNNVQKRCLEASSKTGAKGIPLIVASDISTDEGCKTLINETVKTLGKINVLVNNAGIGGMVRLDDESLLEVFDRVHSTNVRPVVLLCHLALPHLLKTKGNIVNVSSCAGLRPYVTGVAYCSSKSALDMITRCLALELGPKGVRVNSVNPAIVRTPIFEAQGRSEEDIAKIYGVADNSYPLGRVGETIDIAKAIAHLASDDASWTSGLTMWVDGGSLDCFTTHAPKTFLDLMQ